MEKLRTHLPLQPKQSRRTVALRDSQVGGDQPIRPELGILESGEVLGKATLLGHLLCKIFACDLGSQFPQKHAPPPRFWE